MINKNKFIFFAIAALLIAGPAKALDLDEECGKMSQAAITNPDSILAKAEQAISKENYYCAQNYTKELLSNKKLAKKLTVNQQFSARMLHVVSSSYNGDMDIAIKSVFVCDSLLTHNGNKITVKQQFLLRTAEAEMLMEIAKYQRAIDTYKEALKLVESISNDANEGSSWKYYARALAQTNIGYAQSRIIQSIIVQKVNSINSLDNSINSLDNSINNHNFALEILKEMVKINDYKTGEYTEKLDRIRTYINYHLAHAYYLKAYIYNVGSKEKNSELAKEMRDSATNHIEKALVQSEKNNWQRLYSFCLLLKGDILFEMPGLSNENQLVPDISEAQELYQQALDVVKNNEKNFSPNVYVWSQLISRFDKDKSKSIKYDLLNKLFEDISENNNRYMQLSARYYDEYRDMIGAFNVEENKINELRKNKKKLIKRSDYLFAFAVSTILPLAFFVILFLRQKEHAKLLQKIKDENNHRIKNNLQALASSMKIQLRDEEVRNSPVAVGQLQGAIAKIQSVLELHKHIETSSKKEYIEVRLHTYLEGLVEHLLSTFDALSMASNINVREAGEISELAAKELAQAIVELVINTTKHAAEGANVTLDAQIIQLPSKANHLEIIVENNGIPDDKDTPKSKGIGLSIVKAIVEQKLGGVLSRSSIKTNGNDLFRVVISIPLQNLK